MAIEHRLHARCGSAGLSIEHAAGRPFAFPQSPRVFERDRPFFIQHLALKLSLEVEKKSVSGRASLDIVRIDPDATEVSFDAVAFDVQRVTLDGKSCSYVYDGHAIVLTIPKEVTTARVEVDYRATPRRGMYFLEPDEHVRDRPRQVWTQCQEEDARHFFPCHDKPHIKMTTELDVTVPRGWFALSNGELVNKETKESGAWRFHWKMADPHPSYLFTLVAGEFAELEDRAGDVPLAYYVPKGREEDGRRTFARTAEMIQAFGEVTGVSYPWNKYAQIVVSDFIFGGMENTTASTMYEHILLDERAAIDITSDDLIAHELAHQWFGDFVTCRDWSEGWLNEGFATYFEHVWRERRLGRDEYEYGLKADLAAYLGEATGRYRRPVVCQDYDAPLDLFDRHLYEKGGLVLHVLRTELGSPLFWRGVNTYLTRHARGLVETRDFLRALEEVSGRSLGKVFEQLLYKPGHPELHVDLSWDKGVLTVAVKQSQAATDGVPRAFDVPFVLEITERDARREKLRVTAPEEVFKVACPKRPLFVVVDPDMLVVGDVQVKAPPDMLRAQLSGAKTARGRWLAAQALASSDDAVTISALVARIADDKEFWGVRADCAAALGRMRSREAEGALRPHTQTKHPKVRRAVVAALGHFRTSQACETLRTFALKDESYLVEAEAARALGHTRQHAAYDTLVELLSRESWADVVRSAALDGLAALRDERGGVHVESMTKYGHPTRARRAAIRAVPKLMGERKARELLEQLLDDTDPHLRIDVVQALLDLGDVRARSAMRDRLDVDLDARVKRRLREALRDLGGASKKNVDQLKEELERVLSEQAELRTRMAQVEARLDGGDAMKKGSAAKPKKAAKKTRKT